MTKLKGQTDLPANRPMRRLTRTALLATTAMTLASAAFATDAIIHSLAPGVDETETSSQTYNGLIVGNGGVDGGHATYTIDGADVTVEGKAPQNGLLYIGTHYADGRMNLENGGNISVLKGDASSPTVLIGAGGGTGRIEITDGSFHTEGNLSAADSTGANAIINVMGENSSLTVDGILSMATQEDSDASVIVGEGATLTATGGIIFGGTNSGGGAGDQLIIGTATPTPGAAGTLITPSITFNGDGGPVVFNHNGDITFDADMISNYGATGRLVFAAGATSLTGNYDEFAGTVIFLEGAELRVNTDMAQTITVPNLGVLGGNGSVGAVLVGAGGTLAPGNSIGTLSTGATVFADGSTYEVELNKDGFEAGTNNDLLHSNGQVAIESGSTLHVTAENGTDDGAGYTSGTYTVLTADGGLTGEFDALTDDYAYIDFSLGYDANNVLLSSDVTVTNFCLDSFNDNACGAADAVSNLGDGDIYDAMVGLSESDAEDAANQLSGDGHASAAAAGISDTRFLRQASLNRLRVTGQGGQQAQGGEVMSSMGSDNSLPISVWGTGYGEWQRLNNDGNNAGILTRMSAGLYIGGDMQLGNGLTFGVLGGIGHSSDSIASRNMTGSSTSYELGVYGGGSFGNVDVSFGAGQTWYDIATERNVAFGGFTDTLSASYKARATQVFGEVGYRFDLKDVTIEPFAGAALVHMSTDAFSETGGAAALSSTASSSNTGFTTLGLRGETDMPGMDGVTLTGSLAWRHAFGSTSSASTMTLNGGAGAFAVSGDTIGRDTALFDLGADFALNDSSTLNVSYSGEFGAGIQKHGLSARFEMKF